MIGPAILLVMFFIKRYKPPQTESQAIDEKNNVLITDPNAVQAPMEQSPRTRKVLIALFAMMLNSYSSLEAVYFGTAPTYLQYLPNVVISAEKAAEIMMVLSIFYTLGRLLSAFISIKVKPEVMLSYHLVAMATALTILYICQNGTTTTLIYIGNGILGNYCIMTNLISNVIFRFRLFSDVASHVYPGRDLHQVNR